MQTPAQCEINKIVFFFTIFSIFKFSFEAGFQVLINNTVKPEVTAWGAVRVGVWWVCTVNSVKDLVTALTIFEKPLGLLCGPY